MTWAYNDSRIKIKTRVWDRAEIYSNYNNYNDSNSINIVKYNGNNNNVYIIKDDENYDEKDIFIGVSSCNASNKIYDEMIILNIKVSVIKIDNIMIIKVIMLLMVVNW